MYGLCNAKPQNAKSAAGLRWRCDIRKAAEVAGTGRFRANREFHTPSQFAKHVP